MMKVFHIRISTKNYLGKDKKWYEGQNVNMRNG